MIVMIVNEPRQCAVKRRRARGLWIDEPAPDDAECLVMIVMIVNEPRQCAVKRQIVPKRYTH